MAELALAQGHIVSGFSRRNSIEHPNYRHFTVDLGDLDDYAGIGFDGIPDGVDEVILINNAGTLGPVKPVANMDPVQVANTYTLNISAPSILSKLFLENLSDNEIKKSIINISSGAVNVINMGMLIMLMGRRGD